MTILAEAHGLVRSLPEAVGGRPAGERERPDCLILDVADGVVPNGKPPVRIFLGSEAAQHRAQRIFVWSVMQVRDPARVYEIHIMNDLAGFNRFGWLTGFTNYRFAIPHLAGVTGRAIYNDVDQVYLADPGELFDIDMADHGFLTIGQQDRANTSVMIMDCVRMARVWPLDEAQRYVKGPLLKRAANEPGLWGELPPEWNALDEQFTPGESKLLHYTALHTQPWQPLPDLFVYQANPVGYIWLDLERSANEAGFQEFSWTRPNAAYAASVASMGAGPTNQPAATPFTVGTTESLRQLVTKVEARSILEFALGAPDGGCHLAAALAGLHPAPEVQRYDPAAGAATPVPPDASDAVVCVHGLERLAREEAIWVVEELFRHAKRLLYIVVCDDPSANGKRSASNHKAWFSRLEGCSARYPEVHWRIEIQRLGTQGREVAFSRSGGKQLDQPPSVWLLTDGKPGHTTQSLGLAEALGWPFEVKDLEFTSSAGLGNLLMSDLGANRQGMVASRSDALEAPWPDVVIATGWRAAPVARWIAKQSRGETRLVQLGRKGGRVADLYDVHVACSYFHLPYHSRRIETTMPLNVVSEKQVDDASARWPTLFDGAAKPHVVLLVGGSSRRHHVDSDAARRMGEEVRAFADAAGGTVFAITSRRTGAEVADALERGLGVGAHVHHWREDEADNPYLAYLARADVLVVTGESESMLAEAAATGKPMYIYPIPHKPAGLWNRFEDWVTAQTFCRPRDWRRVRPQRGLKRICGRLIARGYVQPRRDVEGLHQALYDRGLARPFGEPLELSHGLRLHEAGEVAVKVRELLALGAG